MAEIIVVGIGNQFRGEDAAGWVVIDALEGKVNGAVALSKQRGDIAEMIDIFANYAHVYVVDACLTNAPEGAWQRIDALKQPLPVEQNQTSTHGFSISQAIAFAQSLDQLPAQLIVYAITGTRFAVSEALSPGVAKAVEVVVEAIINEEDIHACMNKVQSIT